MNASTYEHNTAGGWQLEFKVPEDLKVHWPNNKKKNSYEPMHDVGWEVKILKTAEPTEEEIQQRAVHQWMHRWVDYANQKQSSKEDNNIEDVIVEDDFSAYVDDTTTGQIGKLYSTGLKSNGKIDLGISYPDGRRTILRDCELKLDNASDVNPEETNLTFEYEHNDND